MLAPPAMPECSAIQPAWRPITSTTSTRWWDSAVVCSRSMASHRDVDGGVEAEGEVGAGQVVVDRLRYADDVHAEVGELGRDAQRVLAADRDQRVDAVVRRGSP